MDFPENEKYKMKTQIDNTQSNENIPRSITTIVDIHNPIEEISLTQKQLQPDFQDFQNETENQNAIDQPPEPQTLTDANSGTDKNHIESEPVPTKEIPMDNPSSLDTDALKYTQEPTEHENNGISENVTKTENLDLSKDFEVTKTPHVDDEQTEVFSGNKSNEIKKESIKTQVDDNNLTEKIPGIGDENIKNDASKSFQVLPNGKQQNENLNQELDDNGNLTISKPPNETIRKTSFTVLKEDESIEGLLAGMDENHVKLLNNDTNAKNLDRPKSFKVLRSHGVSGEDMILHQSSDQETGDNDMFNDYSSRNLGQSGKYSDSELIKTEYQINGRRKKYKKRVRSVKQFTIADKQSRDHDSGFEPSPRALKSSQKALTRAIYSANMPENIVDGRLVSSRFEQQRKLGDKNAANMTTVSQSIQRNIRRYGVLLIHLFLNILCILNTLLDIIWNTKFFNIY